MAKIILPLLLLAAQWIISGFTVNAAEPSPITVVINRASLSPTIDGALDDACWKNAQWIPLRTLQGEAAKVGGRAALAFDGEKLYAAFILDEPQPEKINAPAVEVNAIEIWDGEILEWFINTMPEGSAYIHLGWNPAGSRYNVKCYKENKLDFFMDSMIAWMPKWITATKTGKNSWTSEAAIPFAELGQKPPKDGTVWTMNLCRTRNIDGCENSCLSPTFAGFHNPIRFAEIWFNKLDRDAVRSANTNMTRISTEDMKRELKRAFGITMTGGPNLARGGDAESATTAWGALVKVTPDAKRSGNAGYELDVINGRATSEDLVPVVSGKSYRLSGYFRSADMQKPASAYFGLNMYDAQKRLIGWSNVNIRKGTETTLSRAANIGDTVVALHNAATWKDNGGCIAFNIMDECRDLPNFDTSGVLTNVAKREGFYEVQLKKPIAKFYPAATRVREHYYWEDSSFWFANNWISGEWEEYGTYIGGEAKVGIFPVNKFSAGTKYIQIYVQLGNYNRVPVKGAKLWFDDIRLEEISVK